MCGVIGVYLDKVTPEQIEKITNLIKQSSIRGLHATGISFIKNELVQTISLHGAPETLFQKQTIEDCVENGRVCLIAHTRYSTSDLKFNQPIGTQDLAICHNGVISQAASDTWEKKFGLQCKTSNDSELVLQALKSGQHPLVKFNGSMSVCGITKDELFAFRNHERPLWYCHEENGIVFASTRDILIRSGFELPQKCDMYTEYVYRGGLLSKEPYPIPAGVMDLQ